MPEAGQAVGTKDSACLRGQLALLLLCSQHEKMVRKKPSQMRKSGDRTISTASLKFSFRLKRSHKTKEIKTGTSFFDTFSFIALEVEAAEPCLINPEIWELHQTLYGVTMPAAIVSCSRDFLNRSTSLPGALDRSEKETPTYVETLTSQYVSLCVFTYSSFLASTLADSHGLVFLSLLCINALVLHEEWGILLDIKDFFLSVFLLQLLGVP